LVTKDRCDLGRPSHPKPAVAGLQRQRMHARLSPILQRRAFVVDTTNDRPFIAQ
jgi:hypothetical protein